MLTPEQAQDALNVNMFAGDFGSPDDVIFSDRITKTRKDSVCWHCGEDIPARSTVRRLVAKFDGDMRTYRWCEPCCVAMSKEWSGDWEELEGRCNLAVKRREAA